MNAPRLIASQTALPLVLIVLMVQLGEYLPLHARPVEPSRGRSPRARGSPPRISSRQRRNLIVRRAVFSVRSPPLEVRCAPT